MIKSSIVELTLGSKYDSDQLAQAKVFLNGLGIKIHNVCKLRGAAVVVMSRWHSETSHRVGGDPPTISVTLPFPFEELEHSEQVRSAIDTAWNGICKALGVAKSETASLVKLIVPIGDGHRQLTKVLESWGNDN